MKVLLIRLKMTNFNSVIASIVSDDDSDIRTSCKRIIPIRAPVTS
ncbi:hypothetical protein [Parageobacillus thermoglucosidasius]|nr:hypothetical protein [Parageobacillus thermoglucosidasius]KYD15895.1 hypothetical protein B4168_4122 [Anoxybacillus flavithermus]MED4906172.1 hypothetical protein [Parageobacillus thermoglucosidasius]MED4915388.1 hypothetical protein [Parageobacillus thermoglucosidasius]MED4944801.1 hypothetical protein [Parageobacillus thermoglucosidasius]OAO88360.1 hypothetical protein GT23_0453 [Parageobacillus thermoglucosidasius]